jgi:PTH1 family peptidyl-tRNA hydrolase
MKLIVGLGNPGLKYERTRHNLGFVVVDHFLKDLEQVNKSSWKDSSKFKSEIAEISWQPKAGDMQKIILVKPKTYMNNSGMAVKALKDYYKIDGSDIWIINDDIDLPLGSLKIRLGGASAGHRGVESIIDALGTDKFWRFRLGIGKPKQNLNEKHRSVIFKGMDEYVLGELMGGDWSKAKTLIKKTVKSLQTALEKDMTTAMNRFNTK